MEYKGQNFELIEDASIEIGQAEALMEIITKHNLSKDEHLKVIQMIGDYCYKAAQNCFKYVEDPEDEDFTFDLILEVIRKTNKSPDEVWEFLKTNRTNL